MRHDFTGIESNFAPKYPQHSQLTLALLISPPLMAGLYGTRGKDIRATGAEPIFLMTWAYADKPEMTKQLADATIRVANENKALVIPVGLAFAQALKERPDLKLTVEDNRHPTATGSYLEGAVIFAALTHTSPEGAPFLGGCEKPLAKKDAQFLQTIAWKTVKESYEWK